VKDLANVATVTPAHRSSRRPIFLCLGLSLTYPFYSVPVQRAAGHLAQELGTTGARMLTESAIWLYFVLVVGIALFWERRPLAGIGLRALTLRTVGFGLGGAAALFLAGQVGGFVVYTLLRQAAHSNSQTAAMVDGSVLYAIVLAVRAGVIEETLFRGLAIEQLTTLTGNRLLAAGMAMMAFILVHMLRFDLVQLVPIGMVSIVLTGLYLWRRDLMANIIAHAVLDGVGLVTVALQAHVAAH
jgi:uncharacterized protein